MTERNGKRPTFDAVEIVTARSGLSAANLQGNTRRLLLDGVVGEHGAKVFAPGAEQQFTNGERRCLHGKHFFEFTRTIHSRKRKNHMCSITCRFCAYPLPTGPHEYRKCRRRERKKR